MKGKPLRQRRRILLAGIAPLSARRSRSPSRRGFSHRDHQSPRATLVEVTAASDEDRAEPHPVWKVKLWVGMLNAELHEAVEHGPEDASAEMVFVVAGSGSSAAGPVPACLLGSSLLGRRERAQEELAPSVAGSQCWTGSSQ